MAWIPIVASAAGGLASGAAGGKKGGKSDNSAANAQAALAQNLYRETDPLRRALLGRSEDFLGLPPREVAGGAAGGKDGSGGAGGLIGNIVNGAVGDAVTDNRVGQRTGAFGDVRNTPTYLAFKSGADKTYQHAKDNLLSKLPGGGGLTAALAGLEGDRAGALTQGAGQIYENELSRALSLATGSTPTALNSLGQAAAIQSASASAAADRNAQKSGEFGAGLGEVIGSKD